MDADLKPRKPQARTIATRNKILEAARELARGRDLETLTAEAVAKAAGVAKGTVFAHYGDMDGLMSYLLLDRLTALRAAADQDTMRAKADLADPVGALLARMMALIGVITDSQTILRVFMDNIGVTKGHCAPEFVAQLDALDAKLAGFLRFWQESPEMQPRLRRDRSPEEMLDALIAFILHGAILYRSGQLMDLALIEQRLRRHMDAFLLAGDEGQDSFM